MPVTPENLTSVMRLFASGVTVVTAQHEGRPWGMTVTAFCSVSRRPPLVLVCLDHASRCHRHISASGAFAVQILRADQRDVAARFASRDAPERHTALAGLPRSPRTGVPLLVDSLAWLDCTLAAHYDAGDHTVFIGRVEACGVAAGAPLAYFDRGYALVNVPGR